MNKKTITIPLKKATYEDIQALNIELQTQLFTIKKDFKDEKEIENLLFNNIKEKDKEIERLNSELQDFKVQDITNQEQLYNLIEENERLNNIINELEKEMKDIIKEYERYTKYDIEDIRDLTGAYWYGYSDCADEVLCRLKELKGSDKE